MATPAESPVLVRRILEGALVIVFALLVWNNATLRRRVTAAAAPASHHGFGVKDVIRTVAVKDLDGRPRALDLQTGRSVVAIVDPSCASCRELLATIDGLPALQVVSLASAEETRPLVARLHATTSLLGNDAPSQFHLYPQLFIVDRGLVVRTCATANECR